MVKATAISQCNARFASEHHEGLVCVFAGATSGIGAGTLERMVTMLAKSTFYVVGRSAARFVSQRAKLESLNPSCKVVFLEAEFSLLSDVDAVCTKIIAAERKVDFLYMSPGLVPLNGPEYTKEGLEMCFAISYYSRMRLTWNLLPLLRQSPRPRVLTVLNGGREQPMRDEDLGLEIPHHWATLAAINHTTTMTSLAFEHLAENDKRITFVHAFPGWVKTDIFSRMTAPESSGVTWKVVLALIQGLVAIVNLFIGISAADCGERQAFHLTSDIYSSGAWRVDQLSEQVITPGVLEQYRERGWREKVWEHTMRVFEKALATDTRSNNKPT
ncbi:Uncharacterized protein BP5553_09978 [Venustampulla echinocandica]|uniref:NAD(P)-binding protein n=1 Tax=Venustampulla echinocandica TaxID=2656787 RepID=A0A370TB91_9HELO|nr:Uncharacterized protein BP5553_09978 [Venustampulla echinocandica]RDL31189.1 Uncharacterized protein BP5553_09978 [Venustampulla echinocandica]